MNDDARDKILEFAEAEMKTYEGAPESTVRESVIGQLLSELEDTVQQIDVQVNDLYKIFTLVLKDKSSSSGIDESSREKIGAYSPLAIRLKASNEALQGIRNKLNSIVNDSEV